MDSGEGGSRLERWGEMEMGGPSKGGLSLGTWGGAREPGAGLYWSMRIIERVFQGLWLPLC